jgi:hypothetical protein
MPDAALKEYRHADTGAVHEAVLHQPKRSEYHTLSPPVLPFVKAVNQGNRQQDADRASDNLHQKYNYQYIHGNHVLSLEKEEGMRFPQTLFRVDFATDPQG